MGYHRQNSLIVFIFDLTRPPGPLQSGLQKGSFLESNQDTGYGVSSESSWQAYQIFMIFFHFRPHLSSQDPSEAVPAAFPKGHF